jgi:uncharacterized protein (TIGR02679 family)
VAGAGGASPYQAAEYRRLLAAARRSLERSGGVLAGSVGVSHPTDAERKAIIGITGQYRDLRTARLTVRLTERDALAAARELALRAAEAAPLYASCGWYRDWLAEIAADGSLTKLVNQGGEARLAQAVCLLEHLAGRAGAAPVLLPALAADITGDTKALNRGTVLSTLVLRALAIRAGVSRPETAEDRRDLWEASGVVVDDLASRVLVLNLPAQGHGLGEWLSGAARLGVPFYITLHQLMTLPLAVRGVPAWVCENPAVLRRAAAELGPASAPLLCTEGRPSTAFHRLAGAVTGSGGELRYHGDFDWPGIAIASSVIGRHGARAWRMSSADYTAGARADAEYVPLTGTPQPTPWDPGLSDAMSAAGRAVYEESVADALVTDLSQQRSQ